MFNTHSTAGQTSEWGAKQMKATVYLFPSETSMEPKSTLTLNLSGTLSSQRSSRALPGS